MNKPKHTPGPTCILIDALVQGSNEGETRIPCSIKQSENLPKLIAKITRRLRNGQFAEAVALIERAKATGGAE